MCVTYVVILSTHEHIDLAVTYVQCMHTHTSVLYQCMLLLETIVSDSAKAKMTMGSSRQKS